MEGISTQLLFRSPAPVIICSAIRNRHPTRFNDNLNDILAIHLNMVCLWKHAGIVDNLVRNILQLRMKIVNANNRQIIVNANIYLSALSVSKAGM